MKSSFLIIRKLILVLVVSICGVSLGFASPRLAETVSPETGEYIHLSQNETEDDSSDCFRQGGDRHQRGRHSDCPGHRGPGMHSDERGGHRGGMGKGMHRGRGRGHGMGHGMRHGGGEGAVAECPQTRATDKAPEEIYNRSNPLEKTADNIESGRLLFQLDAQPTCTMCHGRMGDGTGMMGGGMVPPPRNFACGETMNEISDGQLFWIIKNGSPGTGMPAFSGLNDEQVWQLIHFLRSLAK